MKIKLWTNNYKDIHYRKLFYMSYVKNTYISKEH